MKKVVKDAEITAKETAEKVVSDVKEAPKAAKKVTRKAVKAVGETVAEAAGKVEKKAEEVRSEAKKAVAKKAVAKKAVKETVYLQYLGKEINKDDLMKAVKEVWTKQMKKKAGDLKSVTLYLKPEEDMAYYVINDEVTGSIEL
ncbi:MAG: DUF6465 family protein [Lachnospiraceae bacterium]|nr:DUF6465 family protein [Lachnospiraceae bacterium]